MIDEEKAERAVRLMLEAIGEDPDREGLKETPRRVARMYEELFAGMNESAHTHLSTVFPTAGSDLVLEKDIVFYSMCEHHLLPFFGKVHIAYLPNGVVTGLSKLARTVEVFARRLQLQERFTEEIADAVETELSAKGVLVVAEAEHTCMTMRGIKKAGSKTVTLAARGRFATDETLVNRVLSMIR